LEEYEHQNASIIGTSRVPKVIKPHIVVIPQLVTPFHDATQKILLLK